MMDRNAAAAVRETVPQEERAAQRRDVPWLPSWLPHALEAESGLWTALILVVPILAVGLELTVGLTLGGPPFVDFDYWWHLATGNWILDHRQVPTTDPFSWTRRGEDWVVHQWLSDLILALTVRVGGYAGAILLTGAVLVAGLWRLLAGVRLYGLSRRAAFLIMLPALTLIHREITVRPQVWGWALLCVLLAELAAYDTGQRRPSWALPLLFVLWVNLHLTAIIGLVCLGIFVADRLLRRQLDRRLAIVSLLSLAAVFINPRGVDLPRAMLTYGNPDAVRYTFIYEWLPPELGDRTLLLFWVTAPLAAVALWLLVDGLVQRRPVLWPLLAVVLFCAQALKAVRYTPIYGILIVPFVGWLVWRRAQLRAQQPASAVSPLFGPWPRELVPPITATLLVLLIATSRAPSRSQFQREPIASAYPVDAATALLDLYPNARLFNSYSWGGYLIYRLSPTMGVYIDGREEMYGDAFVREYLDIEQGRGRWRDVFDDEDISAVLVERQLPLVRELETDPAWAQAYSDDRFVIFVRAP